jgi:CBS domain-containing protein
MIALLFEGGIHVDRIARTVSELNARMFARLWALLAPPALVANSCLVVMGSEGRGEQVLKTDQDNALLLRDGVEIEGLDRITARFSAALAELGYPPCPGGIMLSDARWRQPLAAFRATMNGWVHGADPDGPLNLAIFLDAVAVAGDASLLVEARVHLDLILAGSDAYLARFAHAADQFNEGGGWWARLTQRHDEQPLDLKKLGTFPLVHGVRALALRHQVRATGTVARLQALVAQQQLDAALARDLGEALHALMALKLAHQLRQVRAGQAPDNRVRPAELSTLERDRLQDALGIVRRFRELLRQRFRLDTL